jgi:hypothetical protein
VIFLKEFEFELDILVSEFKLRFNNF